MLIIPGWDSFYTRPIFFWPLLTALLLSTSAVVWLVVVIRKEKVEDAAITEQIATTESQILLGHMTRGAEVIKQASKYLGVLLAGCMIGGVVGWTWRDHQLTAHVMTYRNVRVVTKVTDRRYLLQPAGMKIYDWEFCHDLTMPKELGTEIPAKYVDMRFEQRNGCKQIIGVGFLEISPQESKYVQDGRDSSAPTSTAAF